MLFKTGMPYVVEDYPYGFRLRTQLKAYTEFNNKKGYREVTQTLNPKTNRWNKEKKSTYSTLVFLNVENGKFGFKHLNFYELKDLKKATDFISDNFKLFTKQEVKYLYINLLGYLKASIFAQCTYCGTQSKDLMPLFNNAISTAGLGLHTGANVFNQIELDVEKIDSLKVEGYNPFKVTSYGI